MLDGAIAPASIITLTGANFDEKIARAPGQAAVEFMSYSCSYCAALEPFLQQAATDLAGEVTVFRVNTGTTADLAKIFAITGTPTIIVFKDGVESGRSEGIAPNLASVMAALAPGSVA